MLFVLSGEKLGFATCKREKVREIIDYNRDSIESTEEEESVTLVDMNDEGLIFEAIKCLHDLNIPIRYLRQITIMSYIMTSHVNGLLAHGGKVIHFENGDWKTDTQ